MKYSGFTVVELVVVLVIVGVLAAALMPRSTDRAVSVGAQADQLAGDIRYVQSMAMTQGQRYYINLTAGPPSTYAFVAVSGAVAQPHPATGSTTPIPLASGVTITSLTNLPNNLIAFDGRGIPYTNSAATTLLAANAVITLAGTGGSITLTISPQTGTVTP